MAAALIVLFSRDQIKADFGEAGETIISSETGLGIITFYLKPTTWVGYEMNGVLSLEGFGPVSKHKTYFVVIFLSENLFRDFSSSSFSLFNIRQIVIKKQIFCNKLMIEYWYQVLIDWRTLKAWKNPSEVITFVFREHHKLRFVDWLSIAVILIEVSV